MWAQQWTNILDIVVPFPSVDTYDVTDTMVAQGFTPTRMFRLAEEFFKSIGLEPMTDKFWEYSMIVRPDDRPVQCHASAEDFLSDDDFRSVQRNVSYVWWKFCLQNECDIKNSGIWMLELKIMKIGIYDSPIHP